MNELFHMISYNLYIWKGNALKYSILNAIDATPSNIKLLTIKCNNFLLNVMVLTIYYLLD